MGSFSIWHWLIVLLVVVLVFGSKKLAEAGPDLGKAIRGFKKSVRDEEKGGDGKSADAAASLESRENSDAASSASEKTAAS